MGTKRSRPDILLRHVRLRHPVIVAAGRWTSYLVLGALSPTWALAAVVKPRDRACRSIVIVGLNLGYLAVAICTIVALIASRTDARLLHISGWSIACAWAYFLWSRCIEVLIAFHRDALDRLKGRRTGSDLTGPWRVSLALNSYLELVIDFALLYVLLPADTWKKAPGTFTDALWISASTITTSGSAGFEALKWPPQVLSTLEIFAGVILLVVCFTLYSGGAVNSSRRAKRKVDDA